MTFIPPSILTHIATASMSKLGMRAHTARFTNFRISYHIKLLYYYYNMHTLKKIQYCSDNFSKAIRIFLIVKLDSVNLPRVVSPLVEYRSC